MKSLRVAPGGFLVALHSTGEAGRWPAALDDGLPGVLGACDQQPPRRGVGEFEAVTRETELFEGARLGLWGVGDAEVGQERDAFE
jgi:hypothetical protein